MFRAGGLGLSGVELRIFQGAYKKIGFSISNIDERSYNAFPVIVDVR